MTTTLTDEMREALAHGDETPVYVIDPQSKASYVLLPKADYDRIGALLGIGDENVAEMYPSQEAVARSEGWDDPLMDEYNNYDEQKRMA